MKITTVKGFTLIELLLVLFILSFILGFAAPISYTLYNNYKETNEIEKLTLFLSQIRREAFLYNKEITIYEINESLYINDEVIKKFPFKFKINSPIRFYNKGTSSGGIIYVFTGRSIYKLVISSPFGEIHYERVNSQ